MSRGMRYLEYMWNKDCSLNPVTPENVVAWVNGNGLGDYVDEVVANMNTKLQDLYRYGYARAHEYIEYPMEGVSARITAGSQISDSNYYCEIWNKEELILRLKMNMYDVMYTSADSFPSDLNGVAMKFIAYCMLYVSGVLLDDVLFDTETDSIKRCVNRIIYLGEWEDIMSTKVFHDEYKGHTLFAIWKVDDSGNKIGDKPLFSFGMKKAKMLEPHVNELSEFIKNAPSKTKTYDTSKLSSEEQAALTALLAKMN